jgi:signal transduction histidine kinase
MCHTNKTILVIDDDPHVLDTKRSLYPELLGEDFTVLTADNPETGLRLAEEEDPAVVLLDVIMPEMPGWDVLRKLMERGVKSSVLMLTALDDVRDALQAMELGACGYIVKTMYPEEERAQIMRAFHQNWSKRITDLLLEELDAILSPGETALDKEQLLATAADGVQKILDVPVAAILLTAERGGRTSVSFQRNLPPELLDLVGHEIESRALAVADIAVRRDVHIRERNDFIIDALRASDYEAAILVPLSICQQVAPREVLVFLASSLVGPLAEAERSNALRYARVVWSVLRGIEWQAAAQAKDVLTKTCEWYVHELSHVVPPLRAAVERAMDKAGRADGPAARELCAMQGLIQDLGDLSQRLRDMHSGLTADNGGELLDVRKYLDKAVRDYLPQCERSGITLDHELSDVPAVRMAPAALTSVIRNLVVNAIEELQLLDDPDQEKHISLRCSPDTTTGRVQLRVSDTGRGLAEGLNGQLVFEESMTTKAATGGFGLGLAVTDRLVRDWGGEIKVLSEKGQGATFEVLLPRADA